MEKTKLEGLLVDPTKQYISKWTTTNDFEDIARSIGCTTIECVGRVFKGKRFALLCDEDGKLKPNQIVSIVTADADTGAMVEYFVGKVLILNIKAKGSRLASLTDADFIKLKKCITEIKQNGKTLKVLECTL